MAAIAETKPVQDQVAHKAYQDGRYGGYDHEYTENLSLRLRRIYDRSYVQGTKNPFRC